MPPASQSRRIKGKRITRAFVIGSEAWKLNDSNRPPKIKPGDTTGWRVYVRPVPGGPDITPWLKKVFFVLHETFPNPVRTLENPPFELEETGYGGFFIVVKLYFQQIAGEKQQQRSHFLQLEPYGDEALMAEQARTGLVRSEIVEFIEFNEPTEGLWDALTSDTQWDYLTANNKAKGKGKGRNLQMGHAAPDRSVELPSVAPTGSVYSRDTEAQLLKVLKDAADKCEKETAEEVTKSKEINAKLMEARKDTDIDAKLLALHEKIPPKKK